MLGRGQAWGKGPEGWTLIHGGVATVQGLDQGFRGQGDGLRVEPGLVRAWWGVGGKSRSRGAWSGLGDRLRRQD